MSKNDISQPGDLLMGRARTADYGLELNAAAGAERRRQEARGQMMETLSANERLMRERHELEKKNAALERERDELQEKLAASSFLARTRLVDGKALTDTIAHLKAAWEQDAPGSEVRQETFKNLKDVHASAYLKHKDDPETNKWVEEEFRKAEQKTSSRPKNRR